MAAERSDERLAAEAAQVAAAQRDPRQFGALYEANFDVVYVYVARRVPSRSDAEDITATVFQKALTNLGRFEWRGVPFAAWLIRIAGNEIADHRPDVSLPLPEDGSSANTDFEDAERRAMVFHHVRTLPPDQRQVVSMRFAEDQSIKAVAAALGRSEGAVKQLQVRALRTLRARVGEIDD